MSKLQDARPGFDFRQGQWWDIFCQSVQTGSGAHPVSFPMGSEGSYRKGKAARSLKLTTHFHLEYVFMAWFVVKHRDTFIFAWQFQILTFIFVISRYNSIILQIRMGLHWTHFLGRLYHVHAISMLPAVIPSGSMQSMMSVTSSYSAFLIVWNVLNNRWVKVADYMMCTGGGEGSSAAHLRSSGPVFILLLLRDLISVMLTSSFAHPSCLTLVAALYMDEKFYVLRIICFRCCGWNDVLYQWRISSDSM